MNTRITAAPTCATRFRPRLKPILALALFTSACASKPNIAPAAPKQTAEVVSTADQGEKQMAVFSHADYDAMLSTYVNDVGMVDYKNLLANRIALDQYVEQLAGSSPRSAPELFPTKEHQMAYWINAYNALMMRSVLDHYPVDSVTDIKVAHGVFTRIKYPVGGTRMSLDDIEKGILLKEFNDPRVHWTLTCASMSCPRIDRHAFVAKGLSERLDQEARNFLQSTRAVVIDKDENVVHVSKYFDWYGSDFGGDAIAYITPYLSESQKSQLAMLNNPKVSFKDYDWRLNDQNKQWAATQ